MNTMGNRSKVDKNQTSKAFLPSGDSDDYDMILWDFYLFQVWYKGHFHNLDYEVHFNLI